MLYNILKILLLKMIIKCFDTNIASQSYLFIPESKETDMEKNVFEVTAPHVVASNVIISEHSNVRKGISI